MINKCCFKQCSNCNLLHNCCNRFDKINAPTLTEEALIEIQKLVNNNHFYDKVDNNSYTLKNNNNRCAFYINNN